MWSLDPDFKAGISRAAILGAALAAVAVLLLVLVLAKI